MYWHMKLLKMILSEGMVNFDYFNMPSSKKKWRDNVVFIFFHIGIFLILRTSLKIEAEAL